MAWLTGYPREKVNWFPTVDSSKCVKCGMCMNCGKGVYEWTEKGSKVAHPFNCVVGCTSCANMCLGKAISFPAISTIRDLYTREGIWVKIKKEMQEEGKLSVKKA